MADEIARQQGVSIEADAEKEKDVSLIRRKKAFQNMLEMREELTYPKDFSYKKAVEEAINEKYNFTN